MNTGDIGRVTVDGKIVEVVTCFILLGALITREGLCDKEISRRIAMGKDTMGGHGKTVKACHKGETGEGLGVPNSTIRSGDLDDEESREEES